MEVIRSTQNGRIKNWCKLHEKKYRDHEQRFLIENEHLIYEAAQENLLETLIMLENEPLPIDFDCQVVYVSEEVMKKLKMNQSLPRCMGVCRQPNSSACLGERIVLCDDVQDPGNIGTMIRSAYSFGFDSFIVSDKSADLFNEKVIRSSQGAIFHMNVMRKPLKKIIEQLSLEGYHIYATALHDAKGLSTFHSTQKLALIFGNEGSGVSKELLELADECIFIEMSRFESLNVAMACGICCYWFRK